MEIPMRWKTRRHSRSTRCAINLIALCTTILLLEPFGLLNFSARHYDTWVWTPCISLWSDAKICTASRAKLMQDVQIIVRSGGSEPQNRLRVQLATVLSKVPFNSILVFSDLEGQVDSIQVHDVFEGLAEHERQGYPEFAFYDLQQEYVRQGKDTRELEGGWELCKYSNLAMTRKIWKMQQVAIRKHRAHKKWFIFVDTDTFVEWDNLYTLLEHHDPMKNIYVDSPVWTSELEFAHGGSGYALSYGALATLNDPSHDVGHNDPLYSQYGLNVTGLCCGDDALARVLKSKGVKLKGYWPMFNGEVPETLTFGREVWCEPVISLHHITGKDMEGFWEWIEDWRRSTMSMGPLLFKDLFEYIAPRLTDHIEDWDNVHPDLKIYPSSTASHDTFEHCKRACEADKSCFQFVYNGTTCALSHNIRLGRERSPEGNGAHQYTSGWRLERIREWTVETECASAHWVRSNP